MHLYFALLIVLLLCLLYDRRIFLIVLLGSILLAPMGRYLGGDGYRCSKDCEYDKDGDPKTDPDIYANQKSCLIDCQKLVDVEFEPPVPHDFLIRIDRGGDLEKKYTYFQLNSEYIDSIMDWLSRDVKLRNDILHLLIKYRNPCVYNIKKHDIFQNIENCVYLEKEISNIDGQSIWDVQSIEKLNNLPIEQYQYIIMPIRLSLPNNPSVGHLVTGLVDANNRIIHVVDSNVNYSFDELWERTLFNNLLTGKLKEFRLNWSNDYWKDSYSCPLALQKAMGTGSCQTWALYTTLLYLLNVELSKKELIHILSIVQDKSPELLTQLLFYIKFLAEERLLNLETKDDNPDSIHEILVFIDKNKKMSSSRIDAGYFISKRLKEIQQSNWYKSLLQTTKLPDVIHFLDLFVNMARQIDTKFLSESSTKIHGILLYNFLYSKQPSYTAFKFFVKSLIKNYEELITKIKEIPNEKWTIIHKTYEDYSKRTIVLLNKLLENIENSKDDLMKIKITPYTN